MPTALRVTLDEAEGLSPGTGIFRTRLGKCFAYVPMLGHCMTLQAEDLEYIMFGACPWARLVIRELAARSAFWRGHVGYVRLVGYYSIVD